MKVLHLISSGGMYGAEAVILTTSAELCRNREHWSGIAVFDHGTAASPKLYLAAIAAGLPAFPLACHGILDKGFPARLRAVVQQTGAEVLHAHGYKADLYAWAAFAGRAVRPALVSTCHTWYDNDLAVRLYGAADRGVLRMFDQVVAVSEEVCMRLLAAGVLPDSVDLIRNGVDTFLFDQVAHQRATGAPRPLTAGLVGRLAPEKGVDLFLQAVREVAYRFPEVRFVVAGDGPERPALEQQCRRLDLGDRVQFLGPVADMPALFASLDLLVSASRNEGLPMALLEGMTSGLPVVATAVGAVPTVVLPGRTGLLAPPRDVQALVAAIARMLGSAPLRRTLGEAGREHVLAHFSAQRMTSEYVAVYRRALARVGRLAKRAQVAAP